MMPLNQIINKRSYLQWGICILLLMTPLLGYTQEIAISPVKESNAIKSIYLRATALNNRIYLSWKVKGQETYDVFLVQHSIDGVNFETIDFKEGLGRTPDMSLTYTYIIQEAKRGYAWYRIRNIGMDQDIVISNMAAVPTNLTAEFID